MADGYLPTTYFVSNGHELLCVVGDVLVERSLVIIVKGGLLAIFMFSRLVVE